MSDDTTEVQTTAPITITLNLAELAQHLVPDYDDYDPDDGPAPMGALDSILKHVAELLVKDIRQEYVTAAAQEARLEVHRSVEGIVREVLDEGAVVGTGYSKVVVKPLRELIHDEVQAFTRQERSTGSFGKTETALATLVRTEVDKALRADLATVLDEQRAIFKNAVRAAASQQIADAAAKRV